MLLEEQGEEENNEDHNLLLEGKSRQKIEDILCGSNPPSLEH